MAVYSYGSNNAKFSTFPTWSNNIAVGNNNIELSNAVGDMYPANSAPFSVSEFFPNKSIFFGTIVAETGGTVSISSPYTVGATSSITVKNVIISDYSITIVATANYPYTFHSWRDASGGGGNSLSTSSTLTLTETMHTDVETFYAYFSTTHINPADTAF